MSKKRYPTWLDILGFEKLAKRVAEESGLADRKVRDDFTDVINESARTCCYVSTFSVSQLSSQNACK